MKELSLLDTRDALTTPEGKKQFNVVHFTESAPRYDIATIAMSLGNDRLWKRTLIEMIPSAHYATCFDIACGTGDIAHMVKARFSETTVCGIDVTPAMIEIAKKRFAQDSITFSVGDMNTLPCTTASVDLITASYAIRNAPSVERCCQELARVLRPGGILAILDFSKPCSPMVQQVQYWGFKLWCGMWGFLLHADSKVHGYISESLRIYPNEVQLDEMFASHGFGLVNKKKFLFGMAQVMILKRN